MKQEPESAKSGAPTLPESDTARYAPTIARLLSTPRLPPLSAGRAATAFRTQLDSLADAAAWQPHPVRSREWADACRAGLYLYFNFLDESHALSQELHTTTGSYWHALMHRREPDFSNSKYWFRRVGSHPVYEALAPRAARLAAEALGPAAFLVRQANWDPFAFVDLCESSFAEQAPCHELCRQIQLCEWQLLFDYCYHQAIEA